MVRNGVAAVRLFAKFPILFVYRTRFFDSRCVPVLKSINFIRSRCFCCLPFHTMSTSPSSAAVWTKSPGPSSQILYVHVYVRMIVTKSLTVKRQRSTRTPRGNAFRNSSDGKNTSSRTNRTLISQGKVHGDRRTRVIRLSRTQRIQKPLKRNRGQTNNNWLYFDGVLVAFLFFFRPHKTRTTYYYC